MKLADSSETGALGVRHLKRLWSAAMAARAGQAVDRSTEGHLDRLTLDALGLGLHQALQYLHGEAPGFADFEAWIVDTVGDPEPLLRARLNATLAGDLPPSDVQQWLDSIMDLPPVLDEAELGFWEANGYVVLKDAVPAVNRAAVERALWDEMGAHPEDPASWYPDRSGGIMVELIQHPALAATRRSPRIHQAFAQLWGTADLWVSMDRCGFHPPQTENWPFPGPDLHWDRNFEDPWSFATQGILYLTDTPNEQGALTMVPGFHHRLPEWLAGLPLGADPQQQDLHALGSVAVGARAGDMVIWHHSLPHGSSPNRGSKPRMVQYINMYPGIQPTRADLGRH